MLKLETPSEQIMADEDVTTSLIHELHMECPTPKDSGDVAKSIGQNLCQNVCRNLCQNLHHPDEASKVLRLWFWLRRCCYLISARENWSEMRTVLGEMGGEYHPKFWWLWENLWRNIQILRIFLGTDHGTDQKLIQNTNSQTLQVRMVHISNMVFYQMCLILLPVFVFQVSLSLCFEVSSGLNMVCPQIQWCVCFTIKFAKPATWVCKFTHIIMYIMYR